MKTKLFILVLALQAAWVLGIVIVQEGILRAGQLVLLETRPVDPRDLLRGDYVILSYKISDVPMKLLPAAVKSPQPYVGNIYVALTPGATNQFWEITRADTQPFSVAANEVLLRGRAGQSWWNNTNSLRVEYGLEKYFVPEGQGNPRGKLTVQAAVGKSGNATIKQVFVDGKPYAEAMQNR